MGDGCEPKEVDSRKGNCPDGTVLDPKQGQAPDTKDPKCQIDDEAKCPKPKVPTTRPYHYNNDASFEVRCGEPSEDGPKCDPKSQYADVYVDMDGKATHECKQTQKYKDKKGNKPANPETRAKIKEWWDRLKPENDKREKERKDTREKLKKIEEQRDAEAKQRDELKEKRDKQKVRTSKCATAISLLLGVTEMAATSKRDEESKYEWTTDFFDEAFVQSDDRDADWPDDVDVEQISADVNQDAFLKKWDELIDNRRKKHNTCVGVGKRSLEGRCTRKRSSEEWYDDNELDTRSDNSSSLAEIHIGPVNHQGLSVREPGELEERNPLLALIFQVLGQYGTRLALGLASRALSTIATNAPRLANLMKTPERLFQVAKTGQGARSGAQGMKNAMQTIKANKDRWKKCIKDGLPL
jgi:hypothetical protein